MIYIGKSRHDRDFDPKHGDVIAVLPDNSLWGKEGRERALVVNVSDLVFTRTSHLDKPTMNDEARKCFSVDYRVLKSDVLKKQINPDYYVDTWRKDVRFRSYSFNFGVLSQPIQDYINQIKTGSHDNFNLYSEGISQNVEIVLTPITKKAAPVISLPDNEQIIAGFDLRTLAQVVAP